MRTTILSLSLLAAPGLIAACGDDGGGTTDAPKPPDMAIDATPPDDMKPPFKGFDADEGGEIRVEYIRFPDNPATTPPTPRYATRVTAFAFQNVGSVKFHTFATLSGCTDVSTPEKAAMFFPTAVNPQSERVYHDLGTVAIANAETTSGFTVPLGSAPRDPFFRDHPANKWHFKGVMPPNADPAPLLTEKTLYDVTVSGSSTLPAQTFEDSLYIPAAFELAGTLGAVGTPVATEPGIAHSTGPDGMTDPDGPGPLTNGVLAAGTDLTVKWTVGTETAPDSAIETYGLVGFLVGGMPRVVCIEDNNDATPGSMTIPANMVDIARQVAIDNGGVGALARQTFYHQVRELEENTGLSGKRVDIVGVWCYAGTNYRGAPVPQP